MSASRESLPAPPTGDDHPDRPTRALVHAAIVERARGAKPPSPKECNLSHAFFELYSGLPRLERHARSLAYALINEPVRLFDGETLVGTLTQAVRGSECPQWSGSEADARWGPLSVAHNAHDRVARAVPEDADLTSPELGAFLMSGGGYPGHIGWDWGRVVQRGALDIIEDCRRRAETATQGQADYYNAVAIAWEGVLEWCARHIAALEARLEAAPGDEKAHWSRLIETCSRVPALPARDFREAVQAFHFQHLALMFENPFGGNGPGCVDRVLGPYLDRDLASGAITLDDASHLVTELLLKFHERLAPADGWVESVMVGGLDAGGTWAGSTLSRLIVECYMHLDQTHPAVYVRLSRSAPEDFVHLAARYMVEGGNRAQLLNDDAIIGAMEAAGVHRTDAADYMCGGCMEISAQGRASDMRFTLTHSIPKVLELVMTGGECLVTGRRRPGFGPGLAACASFDDVYAAFESELAREAGIVMRRLDVWSECIAEFRPTFLISSLVADCLERGMDMHEGGARYHDYGTAPVGIPNAADSLYAVEQAIYIRRICTPEGLLEALRCNFVGHERLRRALCDLPKFGQEHPGADAIAARVLRSVSDAYGSARNRFGGRLTPMVFNFVWTPLVGGALGATPDGRVAGEPVAHGLTPQAAGMGHGLTAAMNSSTSLPLETVSGGATTMWDIDPSWATVPTLTAVIKAFISRGGQIMQGNTTSVADLQAAIERPDDFPNLIVRVGGFSARFGSLSRDVQLEIMERHRHRCG